MVGNYFSRFFQRQRKMQTPPNHEQIIVMQAQGTSGTKVTAGRYDEEYLGILRDETAIEKYDEMRRSDDQIAMLLRVIKNPIKSANWSVEPASEDEKDIEIAQFIEHVLFSDIANLKRTKKKKFSRFINEALTVIEYGFVVFEIVHKTVRGDKIHGDYVGLSDIGFRHQRSIYEFNLEEDGAIYSIRQVTEGDYARDVLISGNHIMTFSLDQEGDNYRGISMLRPCYGNWFRKNVYRKLQAIGIERCAKGVVVGTVPQELAGGDDFDEQMDKFQEVLDQLGAHEKNNIVIGAGYGVEVVKIEHDADKVQKVIDSENIGMTKVFLANFMELGLQGNSGSFALGTDLSDIFLSGIQHIANTICESVNCDIIETLVKANYGEVENMPKLTCTGINDKAGKEIAEIVKSLIDSDIVQNSPRMKAHMHELFKLPEFDEDFEEEKQAKAEEIAKRNNGKTEDLEQDDDKKKLENQLADSCCGGYQLAEVDRKKFPVSGDIEDHADELSDLMRGLLRKRTDLFLEKVEQIIRSGKNVRNRVLNTEMPESKAYKTSLENWTSGVIDKSFKSVLREIGIDKNVSLDEDLNSLPKKLRDKLATAILLTAAYQDSDIEKAVYFTFNENFDTLDVTALLAEISRQALSYFDKSVIETQATNMASNVVNTTRKATMLSKSVASEIESFVFMNADPVSPICKNLNGKVFSKEEFEASDLTPPLHHNCKSYIRAQTAGAPDNLPITGLQITGTPEEKQKAMKSKTL